MTDRLQAAADRLMTLQLRYGQALYLAEKYRAETEVLQAEITAIARQDGLAAAQPAPRPFVVQAAASPLSAARSDHYRKLNFSSIARTLGVTPQLVRRVFLGQSTSARVKQALESALAEAQSEKQGGGE